MLGSRLRELLNESGISKEKFAEMCDLPLETVRNVYYGRTPDPKVSTVLKMAKALGIGVNCLMGQCEHTTEEKALLNRFRQCGKHGRSLIMLTAKYEALTAKQDRESTDTHKIPCLVPTHDVYKGLIYDECETVEIWTTVPEAYVALKMPDNNFVPIFCAGDIILLENRFPKHGEYGMFYIDKRAYVRKFLEENGQYRLQSLHSWNNDIVVKDLTKVDYIGTYCGVVRT